MTRTITAAHACACPAASGGVADAGSVKRDFGIFNPSLSEG